MNRGVPPTDVKARTGELTPPGMMAAARPKRLLEAVTECWVARGERLTDSSVSARPAPVDDRV
jgi:hypothetical protein